MPSFSELFAFQPNRKPVLWLGGLLFGIAGVIVLRSVFDPYGQLQNDSYFYLRMAHSLAAAGPPLLIHGSYETTWPPGLPAFIAGVMALSGGSISLFWASKVANILLLASGAALLWWRFKKDAPAYLAVFALAPPLMLLSQTLSEAPFMIAMLAFVLLLVRGLQQKSAALLFAAGLFCFLLFMIRYIGLFALGITLPAALLLAVMGFRREAGWLSLGSFLSIIMMGGWFWLSYQLTNLATGIERTPAPHGVFEGMYHIIRALGDELNMLHVLGNQQPVLFGITLLIQAGLLWLLWKSWRQRKTKAARPLSLFTLLCAAAGGLYFIGIALVHIIFGVHSFYYRLVTPATLLLLFGLLHLLLGQQDDGFRARIHHVLMSAALVCMLLYGPGYALHERTIENKMTRTEYETFVQNFYASVPARSVIVYAHYPAYYLRPDLAIEFPLFTPEHAIQESWTDFTQRLHRDYVRRGYEIYFVNVHPDRLREGTHPSVVREAGRLYNGKTELRRMRLSAPE
ncbi:MAG: hypothetical protein ACOC2C_01690 [Cyclonatronaceae bacterium]